MMWFTPASNSLSVAALSLRAVVVQSRWIQTKDSALTSGRP